MTKTEEMAYMEQTLKGLPKTHPAWDAVRTLLADCREAKEQGATPKEALAEAVKKVPDDSIVLDMVITLYSPEQLPGNDR